MTPWGLQKPYLDEFESRTETGKQDQVGTFCKNEIQLVSSLGSMT